ncbi:MAG: transglycosylase SLT domain-containing protein [Thermodesulfobacteriota bacterium]
MKTGQDLLNFAATRIGQEYVFGADVPTDNPDWNGPWDCAEFVTWVVYHVSGNLYGCVDNGNPVNCDAYTGAWARDVKSGVVQAIDLDDAMATPGAILLRYTGKAGHIVFADGQGRTIEAMSTAKGVCRGPCEGREWHHGILIPGLDFATGQAPVRVRPAAPQVALGDDILEAFKARWDLFRVAGRFNDWDPLLIGAIDIRESHCGLLLDDDGRGDRGQGHGEMQIDIGSFPKLCSAEITWWKDPVASVALGTLALQGKYDYLTGRQDCPFASDSKEILWCAVAAYNKGEGATAKQFDRLAGKTLEDQAFWDILDSGTTDNYASGVRKIYEQLADLHLEGT